MICNLHAYFGERSLENERISTMSDTVTATAELPVLPALDGVAITAKPGSSLFFIPAAFILALILAISIRHEPSTYGAGAAALEVAMWNGTVAGQGSQSETSIWAQ
jgi:hypothetical protein